MLHSLSVLAPDHLSDTKTLLPLLIQKYVPHFLQWCQESSWGSLKVQKDVQSLPAPLGRLEVGPVLPGCGWEAAGKQAPRRAGPWRGQALFCQLFQLLRDGFVNICCSFLLGRAVCSLPGKQDRLDISQKENLRTWDWRPKVMKEVWGGARTTPKISEVLAVRGQLKTRSLCAWQCPRLCLCGRRDISHGPIAHGHTCDRGGVGGKCRRREKSEGRASRPPAHVREAEAEMTSHSKLSGGPH